MWDPNLDQRLIDEMVAFEAGSTSVAALQVAIMALGTAMEAMPPSWAVQLEQWDRTLELARATKGSAEQMTIARSVIAEVRNVVRVIS